MNRRKLLAAPALLAPISASAQSQPPQGQAEAIRRVEAYFNTLTTFRARFLQVAQGGGSAEGTAWIWRPSRMRFEYDPPEPTLLIAADNQFFHYDRELRQPTVVPLSSTPLSVLLRSPLRLSGDVTVAGVEQARGLLAVTVYRTAAPAEGRITLILEENPMVLRQWVVLDAQGRSTRVTLTQIETGQRFDPFLFAFNDPRFREQLDQR
ncbi:outer membrane lipoprotein carrier protein LolA [Roseococcus sp. SYP-B2431]|uniref:LolA family protein n=1 Tax=Roseococcus sp. SYP-B2431 TaxID=2496640 RepID=UPI00103F17C2|nr:outer membrane lipoprotein carrier protein LolA [Roseococcus sp. SYP-B2431]TCH97949.1 outer membrane lipoprotein carrier protein LolA [Roseococcus sp. SYP-B2431]